MDEKTGIDGLVLPLGVQGPCLHRVYASYRDERVARRRRQAAEVAFRARLVLARLVGDPLAAEPAVARCIWRDPGAVIREVPVHNMWLLRVSGADVMGTTVEWGDALRRSLERCGLVSQPYGAWDGGVLLEWRMDRQYHRLLWRLR